jgi:hypothetical protein
LRLVRAGLNSLSPPACTVTRETWPARAGGVHRDSAARAAGGPRHGTRQPERPTPWPRTGALVAPRRPGAEESAGGGGDRPHHDASESGQSSGFRLPVTHLGPPLARTRVSASGSESGPPSGAGGSPGFRLPRRASGIRPRPAPGPPQARLHLHHPSECAPAQGGHRRRGAGRLVPAHCLSARRRPGVRTKALVCVGDSGPGQWVCVSATPRCPPLPLPRAADEPLRA